MKYTFENLPPDESVYIIRLRDLMNSSGSSIGRNYQNSGMLPAATGHKTLLDDSEVS